MSNPAGDTSKTNTSGEDPTVLIPTASSTPAQSGDETAASSPPTPASSSSASTITDPVLVVATPPTLHVDTSGSGVGDPDVTAGVPINPAGPSLPTGEIPTLGGGAVAVDQEGADPGGIYQGSVGQEARPAPNASDPSRWTARDVLAMAIRPLLLWAAGRATTLGVAALATPLNGATWREVMGHIANSAGYVAAATNGYQRPLPLGSKGVGPSAAQFFPGFPTLVGLVAHYGKMSPFVAGLVVSLVGSLLATMVVWGLARAFLGQRGAGDRAAALFSFAPGALLLGVIDPIGLFVVLGGLALWAMGRGRLVAAGSLVALAWTLHPAAVVLTAVLLVAAIASGIRGKGSALAGAAIALLGAAASFLTFWLLTGSPLAWANTQIDAAEGGFWLTATTERLMRVSVHPADTSAYGAVIGLVVGVFGLLALISRRLSPTFGLYTVAVGALAFFLLPLGLGPTALLVAFPIAIGLSRIKSVPFALVMGVSVVSSILVTYLTVQGGVSLL